MLKEYYQLTKPGIIKGNIITAGAGFFAGSSGQISISKLFFVMCGIALVIASGCVFNNVIDRSIDRKMNRTKNRAIAMGIITPKNGLALGTVLGLFGFVILLLFTNILTVAVGLVGIFSYVVVYGFIKRKSHFGTESGTISGATPIVAGYTAANGSFDVFALCLFGIMVIWQMPHFYAIAIFRRNEYKKAGIPLISVVKGIVQTRKRMLIYILLFPLVVVSPTVLGYSGISYAIIVGLAAGYWIHSATITNGQYEAIQWSKKNFGVSLLVLIGFSGALVLDALTRNSIVL